MKLPKRVVLQGILPALTIVLLFPSCRTTGLAHTPAPGTFQRSGEIQLNLTTSKSTYRLGEKLSFSVRPSEDAYIAAWVRGSNGKVHRIYPNDHDPGRVFRGGATTRFPGSGDFQFRIVPPVGRDTLIVIASSEPIGESTPPPRGRWMKGIDVEHIHSERRGEARIVYRVAR